MLNKEYNEILQGIDVRKNLIEIKSQIKEESNLESFCTMLDEKYEAILDLLNHEDPKVRKNAALILGTIGLPEFAETLCKAYVTEEVKMIRVSLLSAFAECGKEEYIENYKEALLKIEQETLASEEDKHIREEKKKLRELIFSYEGAPSHKFVDNRRRVSVLLTTKKDFREITGKEVISGKVTYINQGVQVETKEVLPLMNILTFKDMIFTLNCSKQLPFEVDEISKAIIKSDFLEILEECHTGEGPFPFRIELKSQMSLEEKSRWLKKLSVELEEGSKGKLVNSTSNYEVELRLIEQKNGTIFPCFILYTIKDMRFSYRKNFLSTSIRPEKAALMMKLAEPYLEEGAQILDPFCGVGTMLIERDRVVPTKAMFGIDYYKEAIEKGKENALLAEKTIYFVQKDYFKFEHELLFDEIVTNMPVVHIAMKEEKDLLYKNFFRHSGNLMKKDGVIIMYSNEIGLVKKYLRLFTRYKLLNEYCIEEKTKYYLFIIGVKE